MSLVIKCGLITLDTIALYAASTPPVRAATRDEQIVPGIIERIQTAMQTFGSPLFIKWSYTLCSMAELAAIAAYQNPDHPYSQRILQAIDFTGAPERSIERIQLTNMFIAGSALVTLGSLLRVWCFRTLGKQFTFEMSLLKDHKLVTWGPYNLVRHPSYTGATALLVGAILARGTTGSWIQESGFINTTTGMVVAGVWAAIAALSMPGFASRVRSEDEFLKKEFGGQWTAWAKRVRYRFIPLLY